MNVQPAWTPADTSVPLESDSVADVLRKVAATHPEGPAVIMPGDDGLDSLSYNGLLTTAEDLAGRLLAITGAGGRVAVWSPGSIPWLVAEYACALAGLVLMPINPALTDPEVAYLLELAEPAVLLSGGEFRGTDLRARADALARTGTSELPGACH